MEKKLIPMAEIIGSPHELGFQHGEIFKEQVKNSIECYKKMFLDYSALEWEKALQLAEGYIGVIEKYNSDYVVEMRGLAEGAGVPFNEILALNVRSELVLQAGYGIAPHMDGCTAMAVLPAVTQSGDMIAGYNWDWKDVQLDSIVMLKIRQVNKPAIQMITEAGIIGKAGFNSAGISLFLNALAVNAPPEGLPLHIAMRGILESETLTEAMTEATRMQLGCSANFLIAHKSGQAVDIEISNNDFDVLMPDNGILAHTNHFISSRLPRLPYLDTFKRMAPDSYLRLDKVRHTLGSITSGIGEDDLKQLLMNHDNRPDSICRHNNLKLPEGKQVCTVFSLIINLTKNKIYVCYGNPCENEYAEYDFSE